MLLLPCILLAQTEHFTAQIDPKLPEFKFVVHEQNELGPGISMTQKVRQIMAIDIWIGDKHTDRINFGGSPELLGNEPAVSFEDVNCDGYKDLLVHSQSTGYVDLTVRYVWYLYDSEAARFGPRNFQKPIPFLRFVPKPTINCEDKTVSGIVVEPKDECVYEKFTYHWVGDNLLPLQTENQKRSGKSYVRTTEDWSSGKKTTQKQTIPADNCHQ